MRKRFAALLFLGLLIPAGMAWAEPPISVSHTLTGYTMGTDSVTLDYLLTVKNTGESSISNVTLSYVSLPIMSMDEITLNIETIDSQEEALVPFIITTPIFLSESELRTLPLFLAGTCKDSSGSLMEFLANSVEGGVL